MVVDVDTSSSIPYRRVDTFSRGDGPLCVFAKRDDALEFITRYSFVKSSRKLVAFPCEYEPVELILIWNALGEQRYLNELPYGTRLARRVRILEGELA